MDWRKLPKDSPAHSLIFQRVAESVPYMSREEIYESSEWWIERFEFSIGSSGIDAIYGELTENFEYFFVSGPCIFMADALHRHSGFPFVVWSEEPMEGSWSGHAAVLVSPGIALDSLGLRSFEEIEGSTWSKYGAPQILSSEEFFALVASDVSNPADPFGFLEDLEKLLIEEYADLILAKHLPERNCAVPDCENLGVRMSYGTWSCEHHILIDEI